MSRNWNIYNNGTKIKMKTLELLKAQQRHGQKDNIMTTILYLIQQFNSINEWHCNHPKFCPGSSATFKLKLKGSLWEYKRLGLSSLVWVGVWWEGEATDRSPMPWSFLELTVFSGCHSFPECNEHWTYQIQTLPSSLQGWALHGTATCLSFYSQGATEPWTFHIESTGLAPEWDSSDFQEFSGCQIRISCPQRSWSGRKVGAGFHSDQRHLWLIQQPKFQTTKQIGISGLFKIILGWLASNQKKLESYSLRWCVGRIQNVPHDLCPELLSCLHSLCATVDLKIRRFSQIFEMGPV